MPPAIIVIPARLSSQRLPRKMLLADTGRTLIEHTWRAARGAARAGHEGRVVLRRVDAAGRVVDDA
ncbi:MAG: cytidylyltransferase domain-containing protein, partial [Planctomycetia bacterium]